MKIWIKVFESTRMLASETIEDNSTKTRTHKIFSALEQACTCFDLGNPLWFHSNIEEFKRRAKTRFYQDNFVEEITFDFLELDVLEEDEWE